MTFHDFFRDQKMKFHDVSAQHICPNEPYTTYECIPELVVTVAAARRTTVKKIKPLVYLQIFHTANRMTLVITGTEFLGAVVKVA